MAELTRTDAGALIPEDAAREIIKGATEQSTVLRLGRQRPNMTRAQQRIPVLQTFPKAYFVNGDTGLKRTTNAAWGNVYLNVEEIAVIVPVPENVIADTDYDLVTELMPDIQAAFGEAIDAAVVFDVDKPASWPTAILPGAVAAGHTITHGSGADIYDEILGENGVFAKVEEDGYGVTGSIAAVKMQSMLRGLRDSAGNPLFLQSMQSTAPFTLYGTPIYFPQNGSFDEAEALQISGDWSQLVYAFRQDITMKLATESVITDAAGNVLLNLFQQDSVAYRFVMRLAFALPNPRNRLNENDSTRYPFAALLPSA